MGNCLSGCTTRTRNGGETVISYTTGGGRVYQTTKESLPALDAQVQGTYEKQIKEFSIVRKELEALQTQICHSQAVLASLKFTFLEASSGGTDQKCDKINRTTQTFQDPHPKSLENVSSTKSGEYQLLVSSCPAILHSIAVQTEFLDVAKMHPINDAEYFLPPIRTSFDKGVKEQRLNSAEPLNTIDLDIYRSCRKLSVLPEEEGVTDDSPPGSSRLAPTRFPEQQAHSFESYLLPVSSASHVIRQLSDPTTSRSTRRPLQVSTNIADDTLRPSGVQDSGLGCSEVRIPSPTFTTLQDTVSQLVTISFSSDPDLDSTTITLRSPSSISSTPLSPDITYATPPDVTPSSPNKNSSSDTSLSFQTPQEDASPEERCESPPPPVDKSTSNDLLPPEKPLLSILLDDKPPAMTTRGKNSLTADPTAGSSLSRLPSRRKLVRSFARIGSELRLELPEETQQNNEEPIRRSINGELNEQKENNVKMDQQPNQPVFPSLSDAALKQLGLWLQEKSNDETDTQLPEEDIENKYTSLVLAFKTDKLTLSRRLELQNKLRDQAELNMTHEFETLKTSMQNLNKICKDSEKTEILEKIRLQIDAIYKSALRVSSTAELYGAVQQENRLSKAVDIILKQVDNLKQMYSKEKKDHTETKKLLKDSKPLSPTVAALKANGNGDGKRRASIATLHQSGSGSQNQPQSQDSGQPSERRGSTSRRGSQLRRIILANGEIVLSHSRKSSQTDDNLNKINERHNSETKSDDFMSDEYSPVDTSDNESGVEEDLHFGNEVNLKHETEIKRPLPPRYKFRKRPSFCAPPWMLRVIAFLQWLQPYEDFATHSRYAIASVFVLIAIGIVASNLFLRHEN